MNRNPNHPGGPKPSADSGAEKPVAPLEKMLERADVSAEPTQEPLPSDSASGAGDQQRDAGEKDLRSSAAKAPKLKGEQIPVNEPLDETVADVMKQQNDRSRR